MKLYDSNRAPNPRRVRWVIAEKGIEDIELVSVDLMEGEHKQAAYLAKAGVANVPVLELDDGAILTESVAICRYLESRYPEPNMFGRTPQETAVIEMWTRRAELTVANPLAIAVRHLHPALAKLQENQTPAVAEFNLDAARKGLVVLDARLAQSPFIGGDRITMADVIAFCGLEFAKLGRFRPDEDLVNVHRWMAEMKARPAAKAGA